MKVFTLHGPLKRAGFKKPYRWVKHFLKRPIYFLDGIFIASPNLRKDIALVRLDAIGDFVLWLDAAKEYRAHYPNKKIILIANSLWSELAVEFPYWDEVWPINPGKFAKNYFYRWKWVWRISKHGFDMAIQPTFSRQILTGDTVIRATNAPSKIGFDGDPSAASTLDLALSKNWYTKLISASCIPIMELDRNGEFINCLFDNKFIPNVPVIGKLKSSNFLVNSAQPYCVIVPGASWDGKVWPIQNFNEIAGYIRAEYDMDIILTGGVLDEYKCGMISKNYSDRVYNYCSKTTLIELVELIRCAKIVIANDTGAVHIAAAVKTPVVCILGGGHYGRFMPYPRKFLNSKLMVANEEMECFGCNWECSIRETKDGAVPCIERINPEKVKSIIDNILC